MDSDLGIYFSLKGSLREKNSIAHFRPVLALRMATLAIVPQITPRLSPRQFEKVGREMVKNKARE